MTLKRLTPRKALALALAAAALTESAGRVQAREKRLSYPGSSTLPGFRIADTFRAAGSISRDCNPTHIVLWSPDQP